MKDLTICEGNKVASTKTNAMRILDSAGISYNQYAYESDGFIDGVSVAQKTGMPPEKVFKTLVAQGASRAYYVFVIPVAEELNLKAAAKAVGEKSVEMIKVADINKITGYIRGGCSPVGMKKAYRTVIDSACEAQDTVVVSAGKLGLQIELSTADLIRVVPCEIAAITAQQ
jgi:Cys-tRNA(Pro)/Cys-tRNA(Cys) deacylase